MGEQIKNEMPKDIDASYEGQVYIDTCGNSYMVSSLEKCCEQGEFGLVVNLKLDELLVNGHLEGDSDEPDGSDSFFKRVHGLTLEKYQQGEYRPVLVGKYKGKYDVIDGRHRIVNLLGIIRKEALNTGAFIIKSYIIDFDNPQQILTIEKAKIKNNHRTTT